MHALRQHGYFSFQRRCAMSRGGIAHGDFLRDGQAAVAAGARAGIGRRAKLSERRLSMDLQPKMDCCRSSPRGMNELPDDYLETYRAKVRAITPENCFDRRKYLTPRICKIVYRDRRRSIAGRALGELKSSTRRANASLRRILACYCFRYLLDALYCGDGIATTLRRKLLLLFLSLFSVFPDFTCHQEKPPDRPVNLKYGDFEQLQQVPGIGPVTRGKIFTNAQDVWAVQERR